MAKTNRDGRKGHAPLKEKLNQTEIDKRDVKIWARRTIAEKLSNAQRIHAMSLAAFVTMGFWARLGWMLYGRVPNVRIARG